MAILTHYILPIIASVIIHGLLIGALAVSWGQEKTPKRVQTPKYIKAELVELKQKAKKKSKPKKTKKIDLTAKRLEQERLKKLEEAKRRETLIKKQQEEKEKAKKAEEDKKRQEQKRLQQQRLDQEFEDMLAEEDLILQEEEFATEAMSYAAAIHERIANKFSKPPSTKKGTEATIAIQLVPTGRVVSANIIKTSGNIAFDRAARQAVLDAEEFPELKGMNPLLFEREFRNFTVVFKPEGLIR